MADSPLDNREWQERPLEFLSRITSDERGWNGVSATLFEVAGGSLEPTALGRHSLSMLVGPSLNTTATCDELAETRLQVPGCFDLFPAQSWVSCVDRGGSVFFLVGLDHALVQNSAFVLGINPERIEFRPQLTCRDPRIEHLLWALKAEIEADDPHGRLYAESLGVALASQLIRRWSSKLSKPLSGGLPPRTLKRVLAYVSDRLPENVSLVDIAAEAGLSPSHFSLLFKRSVGVSVHRYVMRRRVQLAVELLSRTSGPIAEVALQCGFANQSHMTSAVRRFLGITPGALRDTT
ncbi:MAG TPA: AraC family transcriptional regulator [Candidatus Cybelea sp.]|jgi:AraC family transcriptional regulator